MKRRLRVLIGCENSGTVRDAFIRRGHDAWSCDLLPSKNGGNHLQCDVLDVIYDRWDLGIFHPTCTYLTNSAAWAYKDPDYDRYPGVGYHQKLRQGTLFGRERRLARKDALRFVYRLRDSGLPQIVIENPIGVLSTEWRKPDQIIQPYDFYEDASKATCLWTIGVPLLKPTKRFPGRLVTCTRTGKVVERWSNQTDSGQNRLPPGEDRWAIRSVTYQGIADAMAKQWGG